MKKIKIYLWVKLFFAINILLLFMMIFSYLFLQNIVVKLFGTFITEDIDKDKEVFIEKLRKILEKTDEDTYEKNKNRLDTLVEIQNLLNENKFIVSCFIFLNRTLIFSYNKSNDDFIPYPPPPPMRLENPNPGYENILPVPGQFRKEKRLNMPKLKAGFFSEQYVFRLYPFRIFTINIIFFNEAAKNFLEKIRLFFLIFYIVIIFLTIPISYLIARQFTRPIRNLIKKTINLSNGKYDEIVDEKRKDEIGLLIDAFNNLAKQLKVDQQFRKQITSEITHDISTPINIIRSYIYGLKDGVLNISTDLILSIDSEIERIIELVDQINLFSGEKDTDNKDIPLISIKNEIEIYVEKLLYLFNKENVNITKNLDYDIFYKIRRNHLRSLIENILKNSIIHNNKEEKKIEIYLLKREDAKDFVIDLKNFYENNGFNYYSLNNENKEYSFSIIIKDNGLGIERQDLPKIFERFYKGKNTDKNKIKASSGVGLSIVREICTKYNINIELFSKLNEGTTVILNFS